jgi:GTP-binding nuclear protein Ran
MANFVPTNAFKICLVGDAGVGKTAYVRRLLTGDFVTNYLATMGLNVTPLNLVTNKGHVRFNIWDCDGQEQLKGLGDGYYINSDAFMVMWDDSPMTRRTASMKIREIRRVCPNAPIILVANKVEKVYISRAQFQPLGDYKLELISTKTWYNFDKPIRALLTRLMGEDCILDRIINCGGGSKNSSNTSGTMDTTMNTTMNTMNTSAPIKNPIDEIEDKVEAKRIELDQDVRFKMAIYQKELRQDASEELLRYEKDLWTQAEYDGYA